MVLEPPPNKNQVSHLSRRTSRSRLVQEPLYWDPQLFWGTRTRTNTHPNGTEANAAGRSGNARALRKQSKFGMIQEGEGHWPNSSKKLQKARNLWVLRTPQNNQEEGARAKKLVTCGTRSPLGRGQSVPFSAQGAYCSTPEP